MSALAKPMEHQDVLAGFIRLHILHHASEHEIYGQWMMDELAEHGYRLSPGTLYPMLHTMERRGYLTSRKEPLGRTFRRIYSVTERGREALEIGRQKLRELFQEVVPADREASAPDLDQ